jgi:hypothetical protein
MTLEGTVVNGVIVPDGGANLPEGTRVRFVVTEDDLDDVSPPPTTETDEEFLASLREGIEDAKAGRGRPAREVLKEIALKHNLPLQPGE